MKVAIINYGAGNTFSVCQALERLGCEVRLTNQAEEILKAERVIFPGVGQASAAMQCLQASGMDRLIPTLEMPVLGICLGMQLMCRHSAEGNTPGLGIFPLEVVEMTGEGKVPHMGWNNITGLHSTLFNGIHENERMYFVHSYYVPESEYTIASCQYHRPFAAAIRKKNFYGCQFHPEKSAASGEIILENFLNI